MGGTTFLAPEFWSSLSESISSVREVLEDCSGTLEGYPTELPESPVSTGRTDLADASLLWPSLNRQDLEPPPPPPAFSAVLLELYRDRVDTVYKVVHLPTTVALIKAAHSEGKLTTGILALEYAIYFMALCTIKNDEAKTMGLGSRAALVESYQSTAEYFLSSAKLLSHPDLNALQALSIYMVCDEPVTSIRMSNPLIHSRSDSEPA